MGEPEVREHGNDGDTELDVHDGREPRRTSDPQGELWWLGP
jgi:hypothetical protein